MKIIRLASNSGHQAALMAGIVETQGDCLIMMDADLQHPPDNVIKFISGWEKGFEIVQGVRTETQEISLLKQVTSLMFYKVFNLFSSSKIKQGSSDFRLLDKVVYRQIQQLLIKSPNRDFMLRALLPSLNCKTQYIEFSSPKRLEGKSSYTKMKMMTATANILPRAISNAPRPCPRRPRRAQRPRFPRGSRSRGARRRRR